MIIEVEHDFSLSSLLPPASSSFSKTLFNGSLCLNNAELQTLLLNLVWHLGADWLIRMSQCLLFSPIIPSVHRGPSHVSVSASKCFFWSLVTSSVSASCTPQFEVTGHTESWLHHWVNRSQSEITDAALLLCFCAELPEFYVSADDRKCRNLHVFDRLELNSSHLHSSLCPAVPLHVLK